jgi:DNA-binding transcriptional LysR family regulator
MARASASAPSAPAGSLDLRSVDLNLLVHLDALVQTESVTRAAERLGLSTPAMSHALARLRAQLHDPLLVRSGRAMTLSMAATELRPRVRNLVEAARDLLTPATPPALRELERTFRLLASDYVLLMVGHGLDARTREQAPRVTLGFIPNSTRDAELLREGAVDLAVGVYRELPPELRVQTLFEERLVCVAREDHPQVRRRLSRARYVAAEHIQVAVRGRPGGEVDDILARDGDARRVTRQVPFFLSALHIAAESDLLLTVPERVARATASRFGLRIFDLPVDVPPYPVRQVWHPRHDTDPAHRWLRSTLHELCG